MAILGASLACCLAGMAFAQSAGKNKEEVHPAVPLTTCTKDGGCKTKGTTLTMDAQWRWIHNAQGSNCIQNNKWVVDAATCGTSCAIEGITASDYDTTYGVSAVQGGIKLKFVNGPSVGSRLYMMEDETTYKMFKLLNREFTFDVDVSTLECGLNGAVYLVEMEANGGLGTGSNKAGAKYGTGYCDAQCPHDLKFIGGECNLKDWHMTKTGPIGHYGSCCSEMDLWEANFAATAYTAHSCQTLGPKRCEGDKEPNVCGDTPDDCKCCETPDSCPCCGRYKGVCDRDGCDYNSYRMGNTSFFGKGSQFTVDTSKPVTVVTQFLTSDSTDTGDLTEIRRIYLQDGKEIKNSAVTNLGSVKGDSITDEVCKAQKETYENPDDFSKKGGLKAMGKSLGRGMVLVLSLWDDMLTRMVWLDSATPDDKPTTKPGVARGPCAKTSGSPTELRGQHPDAFVTYTNIVVGDIGTTYGPKAKAAMAAAPAVAPGPVVPGAAALGPVVPGAAAPGPVVPGAPAAATSGAAMSRTGKPSCCSSAKGPERCDSCWPGSDISDPTIWCGTAEHCAGCGGQWCPAGVIYAQAYEAEPLQEEVSAGPAPAGRLAWAAAGSAFLGLGVAVWARAGPRRRHARDTSDREALCREQC